MKAVQEDSTVCPSGFLSPQKYDFKNKQNVALQS